MSRTSLSMTREEIAELPVDRQVELATRKVMANRPDLNYTAAQEIALQAEPKLAEAYVNCNGYRHADGHVVRPSLDAEA